MNFSISVIIPAFNVERFVEKAIYSALKQQEVFEVIVVNDGSKDKTLSIIERIQSKNPKVKIFHHLNGSNRGRSASRNLGIKKVSGNFISFLDADDYYLPNRFKNDKRIFEKNNEAEVVYNAVGYHYYRNLSEAEKSVFKKLNTVSKPLEDTDVFESLISSKYGYLHLNGLTIKKNVFQKTGLFNESLQVAEDSDIIFKMGLKCHFKAGQIDKPLAIRGIHDSNIYNNNSLYKEYNVKLYESLLNWAYKNDVTFNYLDEILNWLWITKFKENESIWNYIYYWFVFSFKQPQTVFSIFFFKYFPIVRLRKKLFPRLYTITK